jgi:hypothetical protein
MALFGKTFNDYIAFSKTLLVAMALIGLLRLVLSAAGVPASITNWTSMTFFLFVTAVLVPILVNRRGFGSYGSVLVLLVMLTFLSQVLTAVGILAAPLTGIDNAFGAADDTNAAGHALMHVGTFPVVAVILWLLASVILLVIRMVSPKH